MCNLLEGLNWDYDLTDFLHFPQFVHVSSDHIQEGKLFKVLGSLIGNFDNLKLPI